MRKRVLPYKMFSKGAKVLAQALEVMRLRRNNSTFVGRATDTTVNWGSSTPHRSNCRAQYINRPECIAVSKNKLKAFRVFQAANVPTVTWTTSKDTAKEWLAAGNTVFVRHKLTGHSGQGIETVSEGNELPDAPLYTMRAKRKAEYRVHVLRGTIIDIQQKKRRNGADRGALVWNHGTGYVYCREGIECPDNVKNTAILAVASLGLDFGAVDMILSKQDAALVLEVNTAPGLVGTTISKYKEAFNGVLSHV